MKSIYCALLFAFIVFVNCADDSIKIGILHSLSGTMAISETVLKDVILMLIEEQNAKGGLLGRMLEPVVVDPASNWPLFAEKARQLLADEKVAVVFGCWTSISRKSVLPVFEQYNGLLFYPVQYEAEECSKNVFYLGAAPNQQATAAIDFLMSSQGGNKTRFVLLGTDYVYPRTTNLILHQYLLDRGIAAEDIIVIYTTFGWADWYYIVKEIREFSEDGKLSGKKTCVVSTINGDANIPFYQEYSSQNINASEIPVIAFSIGEGEIAQMNPVYYPQFAGHYVSWNYYMTLNNSLNNDFIRRWRAFSDSDTAIVNDPMEAHYIGFNIWAQAVKQAQSIEVDAVRQALYNQKLLSLSGFNISLNTNHHLSKPVMIGEITETGAINAIWESPPVKAQPWSPELNSNSPVCDWSYPWVCGKCTVPKFSRRM